MEIRSIRRKDYKEVEQVIRQSFSSSEHGYGNEAELVENIRTEHSYVDGLEVVATEGARIIGYGLLSEVEIINAKESFTGLVLAPLAVYRLGKVKSRRKITERVRKACRSTRIPLYKYSGASAILFSFWLCPC